MKGIENYWSSYLLLQGTFLTDITCSSAVQTLAVDLHAGDLLVQSLLSQIRILQGYQRLQPGSLSEHFGSISNSLEMDALEKVLSTYRGRDRVIRTTSYACFLLSGLSKGRSKERLCILGTQLSSCRTVLRLFDDLSMLNYNLQYGFGKQEEDRFTRWLSVITNVVDQLFYPVEHIAWASDQQILHLNSSTWWYSSTFLWFLSLYLNILKVIRSLFLLQRKKSALKSQDLSSEMLGKIHQNMRVELLSIVEYGTDLCNAIHWMPKSFLWGGRLHLWQVGLLGLVSSLIGSFKMVKLSN